MKTLTLNPRIKNFFCVWIGIGLVSFVIAYMKNPSQAWHGYVMNYYYFLALGIGGVFLTATQHLTNAGWSSTIRRIPESLYSWLPWAMILFIPIIFGGKTMYEWMQPDLVSKDHLLQIKAPYLNIPFFIIRAVLFFALWYFVGGKLIRNSLKQDETGDLALTQQNANFSGAFIPPFAILFSLVSFDLIMSFDPRWYSTMYGVYAFANMFVSTIAVCIVILIGLKRAGHFGDSVNENHIQNMGLLLFAFTIFYAYIAFCQFMLIWYANLPEETSYFLRRWNGNWSIVAMSLVIFKFCVPFLLLLPREAKRNMDFLIKIAYWQIFMNWVDTFWQVGPDFSSLVYFPLLEFGMFLGFAGAFGLVVAGFLSRHPVQPQKDPRVQEALHLHQ